VSIYFLLFRLSKFARNGYLLTSLVLLSFKEHFDKRSLILVKMNNTEVTIKTFVTGKFGSHKLLPGKRKY